MILGDTNVLLDVWTDDPRWSAWSTAQLERLALRAPLRINNTVYAEISVRFGSRDDVNSVLESMGIELSQTPRDALFLAGKAFGRYRSMGGIRSGVLADFFIGAHAAAETLPLLTRDARRYRTYFPTVELIPP